MTPVTPMNFFLTCIQLVGGEDHPEPNLLPPLRASPASRVEVDGEGPRRPRVREGVVGLVAELLAHQPVRLVVAVAVAHQLRLREAAAVAADGGRRVRPGGVVVDLEIGTASKLGGSTSRFIAKKVPLQ